jgi:hypothetical protein
METLFGLILVGGLSTYHPGDGHNGGELSCGGRFTFKQNHVAIRQWRGRCGRPVVVCVRHGRCIVSKIMDSGPWGAINARGHWEVQVPRLKPGYRRRGVVDLSWGAWKALGRPRFLNRVAVAVGRKGLPAGALKGFVGDFQTLADYRADRRRSVRLTHPLSDPLTLLVADRATLPQRLVGGTHGFEEVDLRHLPPLLADLVPATVGDRFDRRLACR